jgi:hypothetical protein
VAQMAVKDCRQKELERGAGSFRFCPNPAS